MNVQPGYLSSWITVKLLFCIVHTGVVVYMIGFAKSMIREYFSFYYIELEERNLVWEFRACIFFNTAHMCIIMD